MGASPAPVLLSTNAVASPLSSPAALKMIKAVQRLKKVRYCQWFHLDSCASVLFIQATATTVDLFFCTLLAPATLAAAASLRRLARSAQPPSPPAIYAAHNPQPLTQWQTRRPDGGLVGAGRPVAAQAQRGRGMARAARGAAAASGAQRRRRRRRERPADVWHPRRHHARARAAVAATASSCSGGRLGLRRGGRRSGRGGRRGGGGGACCAWRRAAAAVSGRGDGKRCRRRWQCCC